MSRLLMITRNFPPLVGGMERLAYNMYQQLKTIYTVDLVGPRGCANYSSKPGKVSESRVTTLLVFLITSMIQALWLAVRYKPVTIISGSGLTAPAAVIVGRLTGLPAITCLHGLDLIVDNRFYQALFIPIIRRADRVIVNSRNTARLAENAGIKKNKIDVIHPGVDAKSSTISNRQFRDHYSLVDKKILLSVGRLIPRKGLAEFIDRALPEIVASNPDTILIIIGDTAENALNKTDNVLVEIQAAIDNHQLEDHVKLLGRVDDEILQSAYRGADLCVFPLIDIPGDVEGFGMVAIEAAALGLPTLAFTVGGVVDAIADGRSGILVEPGNYEEMIQACVDYFDGHYTDINDSSCKQFASKFDWPAYGKKLQCTLELAIQNKN